MCWKRCHTTWETVGREIKDIEMRSTRHNWHAVALTVTATTNMNPLMTRFLTLMNIIMFIFGLSQRLMLSHLSNRGFLQPFAPLDRTIWGDNVGQRSLTYSYMRVLGASFNVISWRMIEYDAYGRNFDTKGSSTVYRKPRYANISQSYAPRH